MRKALLLLFCLSALSSCVSENLDFREAFQRDDSIYMNRAGETLFDYNENTCQYSFYPTQSLFRVFSDTQFHWLSLDCKGAVLKEGARISADLEWTTHSDIVRMDKVNFELLKITDGVYYFWAPQYNIALRLRVE